MTASMFRAILVREGAGEASPMGRRDGSVAAVPFSGDAACAARSGEGAGDAGSNTGAASDGSNSRSSDIWALHHLPAAPGGPAPRRYRLIAMSGISEIMASFSAAAAAFISAAFCCASFAWELCGDRIHACAAAVLRDSASR